ncbi:flagella biosynthesis chaperone FliJ [Photorhabdus laumondii subsp. laumondii]|uniref:Flagellar FliJ protein n=2 Tax=Photorhabdus laumondii subsp. laumondii TaxID=141679 RepID=Q7N5K4_PHOLL|nr:MULTISPECIES: flagellar export protein FliJ [Photorhabdus]AWK41747.1 flagellar protein FliJ [Photorhabdus laumondii subsp. laumondii]AXG42566.1 flagella biosynthesis chaperone FliJ [Photorhabdus laumondii subsp. laumondii]AXG47068.1 flagella biosynthesis chaperone FliJ [Photorhabdus laumondii subsp. laumondii]KTL60951.1 flagellar biosynthesis chaperone [Photorhabdus laumondii subsp. laumondii]MCC8382484.1 flagella biosynthesis chaperone FliJ [Photorhabdus laumondii]
MQQQSPLITLRDLAQNAVEKAATHLAQVCQNYQQMEQQLATLMGYQDEYRERLNDTLSHGMPCTTWQNYQQFMKTLEKAIEQHKLQLNQWQQRLDTALSQWREKQQRLNAFDTLQQRADNNRRLHQNRTEQKQMDEYAQRSVQRRNK